MRHGDAAKRSEPKKNGGSKLRVFMTFHRRNLIELKVQRKEHMTNHENSSDWVMQMLQDPTIPTMIIVPFCIIGQFVAAIMTISQVSHSSRRLILTKQLIFF